MKYSRPIDEIIAEIIPPNDRTHREFFNNERLIDQLSENEKEAVESKLLSLFAKSGDALIARTLAYMKSGASVPVIREQLSNSVSPLKRLLFVSYMYYITSDRQMVDIAVDAYSKLNDIYEKTSGLYLLRTFRSPETDSIIIENVKSPDNMISYNAKQALASDYRLAW